MVDSSSLDRTSDLSRNVLIPHLKLLSTCRHPSQTTPPLLVMGISLHGVRKLDIIPSEIHTYRFCDLLARKNVGWGGSNERARTILARMVSNPPYWTFDHAGLVLWRVSIRKLIGLSQVTRLGSVVTTSSCGSPMHQPWSHNSQLQLYNPTCKRNHPLSLFILKLLLASGHKLTSQ